MAEEAPPAEGRGDVVRIIEDLYARRHEIKHIMVATVDANVKGAADMSLPINMAAYSHLWRMMNVKLDRLYSRAMYADGGPASPPAGVKSQATKVPRAVRRAIERAERKVKKANGQAKPE